jgi:hypothetical protein
MADHIPVVHGADIPIAEKLRRRDAADKAVTVRIQVDNLLPEAVMCRRYVDDAGSTWVELGGHDTQITWVDGDIARMRAVVQEIDRQLAHIEVHTHLPEPDEPAVPAPVDVGAGQ